MSEKPDASFQKVRDEALRALVRGGLTPGQVSALKLNEVHLATSTLVMEPDEFDTSTPASERAISLTLDAEMQRTLIDAHPDLELGPVTWGWLGASLDILATFTKPKTLQQVSIPVFVASASEEQLVDNASHLARLERSAQRLALSSAVEAYDLGQAINMTLEANRLADARIRLTVSAGPGERALALPPGGQITVLVSAERLVLSSQAYEQGIHAAIVGHRRNSMSLLSRIKTTNYRFRFSWIPRRFEFRRR